MKFWYQAYLILIFGILLTGCSKKKEAEERYTWSTDAPLTIPLKTRIQKFDKGNLVRNHSFENGRVFSLDSITSSFVIDGWQQIGKNVEWTDVENDSLYNPEDAYSGYRAIRIKRTKAYETDQQGDGIISDFIKVIPGNYTLNLFARLEDIKPNRSRLGAKMFDALDISLLYFDRNKLPVSADHVYPQIDQLINSSFKALSFSNFDDIPSFGWGKITGKSGCFPYHDGDIPSDAHFVKIRIALKGTGTCLIDSVSLLYTGKNFSVAERMREYTDTGFHAAVAVTPTPKKMIMMEAIEFFRPENNKDQLPVIVLPENTDPGSLNVARTIAGALGKSIGKSIGKYTNEIQIVNETDKTSFKSSKLIISIGKTAFYKQYKDLLPTGEIDNRPQGYFLFTPGENHHLVIIDASDKEGLFYAATTFMQLIDNKTTVFHNARITDFPDFPQRFCAVFDLDNQNKLINSGELQKYKMNGALILVDKFDYKPLSSNNPMFQEIIVSGYQPPDNTTLNYNASLLVSHVQYPLNADLLFPAAFNNEMMEVAGYSSCCNPLPQGVKFLYSGSSFFSTGTDEADILRFTSVLTKNPVFMDNSMLIYTKWGQYGGADKYFPGKMRLFNLFEPYNNAEIKEFFKYFDPGLFVVNLNPRTEIDIIRLATAADFMWNADTYSPDYSLWKVLTSRYGISNARLILEYADRYSMLLEIVLKLELNMQTTRNIKAGQQNMAELTKKLSEINVRLGAQNKLVKELKILNADLRNRLNQQIKRIPVKK